MIFLQTYKQHKIFLASSSNYYIGYALSDRIWKRNIKSLTSCKRIITCAWKELKEFNKTLD